MTKVTILMPVYNGSKYLEKSVGSILAQTYKDWELVALDDGSKDDSLNILERFAATDSRIKTMHQPNDGKGNTARNISIMGKEAEGDYIFYMSQDDYLSEDVLANAVKRAEETGAEVVLPDMLLADADGTTEAVNGSFPPNGADYSTLLSGTEAFFLSIDFSIHGFALIHRRLMLAADNDTRFFDSDEYNTRIQFMRANKVAFCHGTFYYYQGNKEAMTKKFSPRQFERLDTMMMLGRTAEQTYRTEGSLYRKIMNKIRCRQMQVYLNVLILLFNNAGTMTSRQYAAATAHFKAFECGISFKGFHRSTLGGMGKVERLLCAVYFVFGTCRILKPLHDAYKRAKR